MAGAFDANAIVSPNPPGDRSRARNSITETQMAAKKGAKKGGKKAAKKGGAKKSAKKGGRKSAKKSRR
jgi:hypothetical protein